MSFKVVGEVLDKSQARGIDRLVLVAIAECAWHDGVTWLRIGSSEYERKTICASARCSKREVIRAVQALRDELRELETRKVRRGRSFITVYRVVVGRIAQETVDYERVPFPITPAFLEGDDLARWIDGENVAESPSGLADTQQVQGDDLAPSSHDVTVPDGDVHGASRDVFKVTDSRARVERTTKEPSDDRSGRAAAREPVIDEEEGDLPDLLRTTLRHFVPLLETAAKENLDRVEFAPRLRNLRRTFSGDERRTLLEHLDRLRGETAAQAYHRWIDEKAADDSFPLDEIRAVVDGWDDLDDIDRQELLERAENIRAGRDQDAGKAAA